MHSPTEPDPTRQAKRRLPSILLSLVLHLSILALAVQLGRMVRTRVIEPADRPVMALLENAGGSHAVKIPLPPSNFAAHTRKPNQDFEASRKSIVPIEQPQREMSGGGAPKPPHAGDGSNQALNGNGHEARPDCPRHGQDLALPASNSRWQTGALRGRADLPLQSELSNHRLVGKELRRSRRPDSDRSESARIASTCKSQQPQV